MRNISNLLSKAGKAQATATISQIQFCLPSAEELPEMSTVLNGNFGPAPSSWTAVIDGDEFSIHESGEVISYCGVSCRQFEAYKKVPGQNASWLCPQIFVPVNATKDDVEQRFAN